MKRLNVGVIGCGFMGRTHLNAFQQTKNFFNLPVTPVLQTVCARNPERAKSFAAQWGYKSWETDWRKVVASPDIDLIDIASPNDTHAEMAIAAAQAGKIGMWRKPVGRKAAESGAMVAPGEKAGVA